MTGSTQRPGVRAGCPRVALLALFLLSGGTARAEPPRPLFPAFDETILEEVKVGGPFVLGSLLGEGLAPRRSNELHVWIPRDPGGRLCLHVRSIDGLYEAVQQFDVTSTPAGHYTLRFDAPKLEELDPYDPGELILDGRLGADCADARRLPLLPLAWSGGVDGDSLVLFVNTDRNSAKVIAPAKAAGGQPSVFDCQPIPPGRRQRIFNQYCVLRGLSSLDLDRASLRFFRVNRRVGGDQPLHLVAPHRP